MYILLSLCGRYDATSTFQPGNVIVQYQPVTALKIPAATPGVFRRMNYCENSFQLRDHQPRQQYANLDALKTEQNTYTTTVLHSNKIAIINK